MGGITKSQEVKEALSATRKDEEKLIRLMREIGRELEKRKAEEKWQKTNPLQRQLPGFRDP